MDTSINKTLPEATTILTINSEDLEILDDSTYIWIPFLVLFCIIGLSALVYLMARNSRHIRHVYCKRKLPRRYYLDDNFDADMEQSLLSDSSSQAEDGAEASLLSAKLQINNQQQQQNYEAFDTTPNTAADSIIRYNNNKILI